MWKSDLWRLFHIGDFFTDLALKILGGEKTAGLRDFGDIENWDLDAIIEVKGCSNRNSLKIYSQQLDQEIDKLGFPFSFLWYAIFFYRNQWADKRRSISKETRNRKSMDVFLSRNLMVGFVLDARVLAAIRDVNGAKTGRRVNKSALVVNMNKGTLHDFVREPQETLARFRLKNFSIQLRKITTEFRGNSTNFDLVFILPKEQISHVLQLSFDFNFSNGCQF